MWAFEDVTKITRVKITVALYDVNAPQHSVTAEKMRIESYSARRYMTHTTQTSPYKDHRHYYW